MPIISKKYNNYGALALSKARKLKETMNRIEDTTIGDLVSNITALENKLEELTTSFNQLKADYDLHKHPYVNSYMKDTADGTGWLISENNTTGVKN
ncbi:MAG: hypothetical protein ACMV1K_01405 [Sulfurospirillum sp.]